MSAELIPGLRAFLLADPDVASTTNGVIVPLVLGQNVSKGMTYRCVGGNAQPTFDTHGPQRWRVQFDCIAITYAEANNMRDALFARLDGFSGQLPSGIWLTQVDFIQPLDMFDNEPRAFRLGAEYYVGFNL